MADKKEESKEVGICGGCGAAASLKCSGCKQVFYCQRKCQKEDWLRGHKENCKPFQVFHNSILGKHVVATRDIKSGDIIFKEDPLVIGPKQITEPVCLGCYKRVNGKYRCGKCNWPLCGPMCEKALDHIPECIIGQQIGSPIDIEDFSETNHFYELVTPLRCLILKKSFPKKYKQIREMESHYSERKSTKLYDENQKKIVNMLRNYFFLLEFSTEDMDYSEQNIHRITGILDVNSIDLNAGSTIIRGLYPTMSLLEHCCLSNVKYNFNENNVIIAKAAIDIKKGDHLSIAYCPNLWGTIARRECLKENYYFLCQCSRCGDPSELNTNFSSLRCSSCPLGYVTSAAPLDELADWICNSCNMTMPVTKVKELISDLGEKVEMFLMETPSVSNLENFISKFSSTLVHENHFHLFAVKHSLLQLYGRDGDTSDEAMSKKEKLCQNFLKMCTTLDPGMCRLVSYTSVALYEYHLAILKRSNRDTAKVDTVRRDLESARRLLHQCVKMLKDEPPENQQEVELRRIAEINLKELNTMLLAPS